MQFLSDLWLPIAVSAALVFVVSSVIHMALHWHKGDYRKVSDEDRVLDAMRSAGVEPGLYMLPCPGSMKDMGTPEMVEKYKRGPVAFLSVMPPGPPTMGKSLVLWFIYSLLVGLFAAYVAWHALGRGADYLAAFRITGAVAFVGYSASYFVDTIWKGSPWNVTAKFMVDGLAYALVTAGTFGWLWPAV